MITTVTLGSGRFNISDKGYERLRLHMRKLTGSLPESMRGVVEEDAESRLCEYFSSKVSTANIITHLDVDAAFADLGLGSVSDEKSSGQTAGGESPHSSAQEQGAKADGSTGAAASGDSASGAKANDGAAADEPKPQNGIPWSLNRNDVLIAGVCSGIARKAGCEAVWIRLAFVFVTLFLWQPWVPVAYLILWFVLPADDVKDGGPDIRFESESRGGGCLRIFLIIALCVLALAAVSLGLFTIPFFIIGL